MKSIFDPAQKDIKKKNTHTLNFPWKLLKNYDRI